MNIIFDLNPYNVLRPIIDIKINNVRLKALIDTGSVQLMWTGNEVYWKLLNITEQSKFLETIHVGGFGGIGGNKDAYKVNLALYSQKSKRGIVFEDMALVRTDIEYSSFQVVLPYWVFEKFDISITHEGQGFKRRGKFIIDTKDDHMRYRVIYKEGVIDEVETSLVSE